MSNPDVERIEQEIEQTRGELADTVEALAYKADVPARARERATAVKERATESAAHAAHAARERADQAAQVARQRADQAVHAAQEAPPRTRALAGGVAAALVAVGAVWLLVRRRRSS